MKKMSKRILSAVIAVIMIFSVLPLSSFAADDGKIVAKLSFFCTVRSPGHTWLYIENVSNKTIDVGAYKLPAGEGVSVGTFGPTRYDGYGIYYNVESYCQTRYGMKKFSTLTEELTADEMAKLHNGILTYKNGWNIFRNCVTFSAKMWNLVSDKKMSNLIFPAFSNLQMNLKGCKKNNIVQFPVSADEVFRQKGNGADAYLVTVSSISLGDLK